MANEHRFDGRAELYARSRPGYAEDAIRRIFALGLPAGGTAADIGAGTGILTAALLSHGAKVYAVEPNAEMRAKAEARFCGIPAFHSVSAGAEATTLPAHFVDAVTAGSAFHWFDAAAFARECRRILRPAGRVFLLLNARDYADSFTQAQHALCEKYCPGFQSLAHGLLKTRAGAQGFFGGDLHEERFPFPLTYTREAFVARSLSSSYAPPKDDPRAKAYSRALLDLLDTYFPGRESFTLPNDTVLFWGRLTNPAERQDGGAMGGRAHQKHLFTNRGLKCAK